MKTNSSSLPIISAVAIIACMWGASGVIQACTPKREAATINQIEKRAKCAMQNLDRTPEQMLIDCGIPRDAEDVSDIIDIFVGAQNGAIVAGAPLPHAGASAHRQDAGSK